MAQSKSPTAEKLPHCIPEAVLNSMSGTNCNATERPTPRGSKTARRGEVIVFETAI